MSESMTPATPLLEVDHLSVYYPGRGRGNTFYAVNDVSLQITRGETLGLVGESGSGKTTIARAIQGLISPTRGSVRINGTEVTTRRLRQRRALAQTVQTVFQDPFGSLNPSRRIGSIVEEGLLVQSSGISREQRRRQVREALDRVGLPPDAADRLPRDFSGGQRQRIAIARATITRPPLVICDEAVSALDLSVQAQVLGLLAELQSELQISYLFITHDLAVVRHVANRVVVLDRGRIVDRFSAGDDESPDRAAYTRRLFDAAPVPDPDRQRAKRAAFEALDEQIRMHAATTQTR